MASRNDEAQLILLAGILLTLAFMLFSIQLALLANVGQQTGRETETPLLEDYFGVRRSLQSYVLQEARPAPNGPTPPPTTPCPTAGASFDDYADRVVAGLGHLAQLESDRGQAFRGTLVTKTLAAASFTLTIQLDFTDGPVIVQDRVEYKVNCT